MRQQVEITPEDVEREKLKIQDAWTDEERQKRAGYWKAQPYKLPEVKTPDFSE